MTTTYTPSISYTEGKDYILEQFDNDELKDIAQHGCVSGVPGFTYYSDTLAFFDAHENEIEEALEAVFGSTYLSVFAQDVCDITQLKNAMVWCFVEMVANDAIEE